jgi:PAS domain S-box-containing protein
MARGAGPRCAILSLVVASGEAMPMAGGLVLGMVAVTAASPPCAPGPSVPLSAEDQRVAVGLRLEVLRDASRTVTLEAVQQPEVCALFAAPRDPTDLDFIDRSRFWVRFRPVFPDGPPRDWLLYLPFAAYERVCVHWPVEGGGHRTTCAGLGYPVSSRPVAHNRFVFPLPDAIDPGRPVLIELESMAPAPFRAELVRAGPFIAADHRLQFLTGAFSGILLGTVLYNLIFSYAFRDRASLLYALHLLSLGLAMLGFEGHGPELVWPWLGRWGAALPTMFLGGSFLLGCLYGRDFLLTRRRAPWSDRSLLAATRPAAAALPASLVNVQVAEQLAALAGLAFVLSLASAGFALARKGDRPALYMLFGLSAFLLGTILVSVRVLGFTAMPDAVGKAVVRAGLVIGSVAMSLGLGRRVVELRGERDRAEQARAAAAQFAEEIVGSAAEGIIALDRELRIQLINPFLGDLLGLRPPEVIGRRAFEVFPRAAEIAPQVRMALAGETVSVEATQAVLGRRPWVSITLGPRRAPSGDVVGVIGLVRDVTALRRAEDEHARLEALLRRAAEEWQATFDAVDVMLVLVDRAGRIVRLNRAAAERLGGDGAFRVGGALGDLGPGEPWATGARLLPRVERAGAAIAGIVRDAGSGATWGVSLIRVPTPAGADEKVVVVARDLTEVVRLEDSLRRKEHLSAMGSLVAGVAHEVRNPLFAVSSILDAFEARFPRAEGAREYLPRLRAEVDRVGQLMNDLLDYGRPLAPEVAPQDLSSAIDDAMKSCEFLARSADLALEKRVAPGLGPVLAERKRLVQVFLNLLENALRHSPRGGRVIVEAREADPPSAGLIEARVRDFGVGFDPADLPRVFEPFFTRRRGGTGLGLSIVQRIVEQHGGRVEARNHPEGGAEVIVLLPAAEAGAAASVADAAAPR